MVQQLTVLIVDDSPEDRVVYRRCLLQNQEERYTIVEAESGEEALILCEQSQPDGILLDFMLPDMDGLEFMTELQQQSKESMPAVIMLTGYGNENIAVQAMKSGVQDYLVKGQTTAERLRSTIESAIAKVQLNNQLRQSEERFRTSVENMLDCFSIYSAIRNCSGNIIDFRVDYVNAAACEYNQMTKDEQLGKRLCEILPIHQETGLFDEYCRVVETGKPLVKESLTYTFSSGKQHLSKAFDLRASKMGDGIVASWRDVTAKKQAEEDLRETQQFLERIAETTPGILYVYDLVEQRNIYLNCQVYSLLGYSSQQIQAWGTEFLQQIMHPEDLARFPSLYERFKLAEEGEILENEYRMQHASGEWRWFFSRDTVFTRTANGTPRQIVGTAIDITSRKQSEAKFQRIVESNIVGIYFGDFSGKIYEANDAFLNIVGYTRAELEAGTLRWDVMTPPEYQNFDQGKIQELQTAGVCTPFEKEYLRKDETRVPILLGIALIPGRKEEGYSVCFVLDQTQRKRAEAALRQSEERYRYLSNAMPQLVWINNAQGECEHINQRWYEYTGQTSEDATGFGWTKVLHPDDISSVMRAWLKALNTGELYEQELRYKSSDGTYRWHLARAMPIKDEQGRVMQWFGTSTDIDDRKQLEAERARLLQLEQAARAEAEAANHAKDEFVAMVSHDLRSPLQAIIGWSSLLRTGTFDQATISRALESIEHNAQLQAKLLEDLLNISRILRGKLQLELGQVNLVKIIKSAIETAYPSAKAKSIDLEADIDESIPPIIGDGNRLLQVWGNLLSNAIKFTPSGGRVEIRLSRQNSHAQIIVSDTGIGIKPEFLPYVFERYRQAERMHKQGGLGLGLAIARHIIELHGGTIAAASPGEGQGATFTVQLPL